MNDLRFYPLPQIFIGDQEIHYTRCMTESIIDGNGWTELTFYFDLPNGQQMRYMLKPPESLVGVKGPMDAPTHLYLSGGQGRIVLANQEATA